MAQSRSPQGRYNLVVLGGGTAGLVSAAVAAGLGAKVALIERHLLGGDCLNIGCVPSKALIRAGAARHRGARRRVARRGRRPPRRFPTSRVAMERMREIRARIAPNDSAARFARVSASTSTSARAASSRPTRSRWAARRLSFARAVLATGARATAPPIPGLAEAGYLTNETVFSLTAATRAPRRDRRRADRLRAGADLRASRNRGDALRGRRPDPGARGPRRGGDRAERARARRRAAGARREGAGRPARAARRAQHPLQRRRRQANARSTSTRSSSAAGRAPNVEGIGLEAGRRRVRRARASWSTTACAPRTSGSTPSATAAWRGSSRTPPTPRRRSSYRTRSSSAARSSRRW